MISVIIPTRNRADLLEKTLNSLLAQTFSQDLFEVIVVDNGSTDNTFDIVNSFQPRIKNIRYFFESEPGLHVGRHKGCIVAESNLLVYVDDDIEALPTWLQAIKNSFDDEEVVLVGGKCLPKFEYKPPEWLSAMWSPNEFGERILGHLSVIDLGDNIRHINPNHVYGCNFAIRRSVLIEAGGFHPDGMPQALIHFRGDGETFVSNYVQVKCYKALYNPSASIFHWVSASRMTMEYFCQRSYNQGISDSYTAIRHAKGIGPEHVMLTSIEDFCRRIRRESVSGIFGVISRITKSLVFNENRQGSLAGGEHSMRRNLAAAYQKGYDFHQAQVRKSPELLAWVLKSDYWD